MNSTHQPKNGTDSAFYVVAEVVDMGESKYTPTVTAVAVENVSQNNVIVPTIGRDANSYAEIPTSQPHLTPSISRGNYHYNPNDYYITQQIQMAMPHATPTLAPTQSNTRQSYGLTSNTQIFLVVTGCISFLQFIAVILSIVAYLSPFWAWYIPDSCSCRQDDADKSYCRLYVGLFNIRRELDDDNCVVDWYHASCTALDLSDSACLQFQNAKRACAAALTVICIFFVARGIFMTCVIYAAQHQKLTSIAWMIDLFLVMADVVVLICAFVSCGQFKGIIGELFGDESYNFIQGGSYGCMVTVGSFCAVNLILGVFSHYNLRVAVNDQQQQQQQLPTTPVMPL